MLIPSGTVTARERGKGREEGPGDDLNPLSRTSLESHVTVVDELTRAVPNIERAVEELRDDVSERRRLIAEFDNVLNLRLSRKYMCQLLEGEMK